MYEEEYSLCQLAPMFAHFCVVLIELDLHSLLHLYGNQVTSLVLVAAPLISCFIIASGALIIGVFWRCQGVTETDKILDYMINNQDEITTAVGFTYSVLVLLVALFGVPFILKNFAAMEGALVFIATMGLVFCFVWFSIITGFLSTFDPGSATDRSLCHTFYISQNDVYFRLTLYTGVYSLGIIDAVIFIAFLVWLNIKYPSKP